MIATPLLLAGIAIGQTSHSPKSGGEPSPSSVVDQALAIMGGKDVTVRVQIFHTEENRLTYHLADSEHSLPPYIPDYSNVSQWIDPSTPAFRSDSTTAAASGDKWTATMIARQGYSVSRATFNGTASGQRIGLEPPRWALQDPLVVLLIASRSAALQPRAPDALFGVKHWRAAFDARGYRVTLWVNSLNHHLDAVDIFGADRGNMFWNEWGDITLRIVYSDWHYEGGGLHYPHQWNIYFNGELQETHSIQRLTVNPDMAKVDMTVPEEGRPTTTTTSPIDDTPLGRPDRPIDEIAPGVVQIPGGWYVTIVKQPDGLVIIDAPISNGYSRKVIEEAARRFPNVKIKAVIATTNFWWHIAGLREYAARRIPIYAPDENVSLIHRLLTSPHTVAPDSLQKSKAVPVVIGVSAMQPIGERQNKLILYPIRAATAQMLMTWFPESLILHTAEMAQPLGPNGSFLFPESLLELQRAIQENGLQPESIIGMHMSRTPWSAVDQALALAAEHGESE